MQKIIVQAPAKLNLVLNVTGVTPSQYHTVDMIMQTIGLYDTIEVRKTTGYSLQCPGFSIPTDGRNTATKAADLFFKKASLPVGAEIIMHKTIPAQAGMAGGSADAAAVLIALNKLYNTNFSTQQLCEIGAQIGADVPFSILGGTVRATGIGEILTPLPPLPSCWFAIGMPSAGVSTPAAYQKFDELATPIHPQVQNAIDAIEQGNLPLLAKFMQNSLEQASGTSVTTEIRNILDAQGALASMMTGSGAAVFGMFTDKSTAQQAANAIQYLVNTTYIAASVQHGPLIVQTN